ncbi:hypothetical protein VdG1_08913 [Verticillium dahliae VDG1]|nr:hypothetical protein VdG1_08913 [Verticillium dahliae VDG1]
MRSFRTLTILMGMVATVLHGALADTASELHNGKPVGKEVTYQGVKFYVSTPSAKHRGKSAAAAVLFLTDITGIQAAENKLLVDGFAREGFVTVAPDLFDGSPAVLGDPNFNVTKFLGEHPPAVTDPIVDIAISFLQDKLKVKKIAASGYCYGGRYAIRALNGQHAVNAGFAAHPTAVTTEEVRAVQQPLGLANAQNDPAFTLAQQTETNIILGDLGHGFAASLYSGVRHGFAVRANVSEPQQKFAKEEAFAQASRFFKAWA